MAIDFKNLLLVLPHVTSANHPVLLRGRHGIGKSSVVYQYAGARNACCGTPRKSDD